MLILKEGGFTSVLHDELISSIKDSIKQGHKTFLFVPEQQTLTAEKEMCDILPPSAPLSFEVTNFTRFINTAFRTLGGLGGEYITSAKKLLMLWSAMTELSPMLNITRGAANVSSGVVSRVMEAINELDAHYITPADIAMAIKSDDEEKQRKIDERLKSEARLRSKLDDLMLIYSLYKDKLKEKYSDMTEDTVELARRLTEDASYIEGAHIYIEGFTSFTEPQYKLISALIKGATVTVALGIPKALYDAFEFTEVRKTKERLIDIAKRDAVDIKLFKPDAKSARFDPLISELSELIWRLDGKFDNDSLQTLTESPEIIRIYKANTPFDESDFTASDIRRRVMAGASYRDFAIIVGNVDGYLGILDTSLEKAGIPYYMSRRDSITSFEAVKLIMSAYTAVFGGFSRNDVMTYIKCGLSSCTREESDLFEIYVNKWSIDGRRFTDGNMWNMNPRGYSGLRDGDSEKLIRLNEIRERVISPLENLADGVKTSRTVREHAECLLDFMLEIDLEGRLIMRAEEQRRLGESESADVNSRLWGILCDALDTLVECAGDTPADAESFINQLSVVLGDVSIGSIPSHYDEVSIGQADMMRLSGKKHVYLIGVNNGVFPRAVSDSSYFTSRDKATLMDIELNISGDIEVRTARERYSFSRALTAGMETVTLLFTEKTTGLSPILPSEVIERITALTDGKVKVKDISALGIADRVFTEMQAVESYGTASPTEKSGIRTALLDTDYKELLPIIDGKLDNGRTDIGEEVMGIILGDKLYLSQSKIDSYLKCPFKYFARSILKLDENEKAEINHAVVGTFIHSVLEGIFGRMIHEGRSISDLSPEERESYTLEASRKYAEGELGMSSSAKINATIEKIKRAAMPIVDGLCDEFANCRFTPVMCEVRIGEHDPKSPSALIYKMDGRDRRVVVNGIIDRVDAFKVGDDVYVRVVDYKTGMKEFSLDKVKDGENLQMLLYLKSVVETKSREFMDKMGVGLEGEMIPAGIVYVKTSVDDVIVDKSSDEAAIESLKEEYKRLGASLDDERSLSGMSEAYIPSKKGKKTGNVPITYTREEWETLGEEIRSVILGIADDISAGHFSTEVNCPKSDRFHPCNDCKFKYICRNVQNA